MHPRDHIHRVDGHPALIMAGSGESVSFAALDARANQVSHLLRAYGLGAGDRIAFWMENHPRYLEICWGAHNAGLLYVPISSRLKIEEAAYIARDCGAALVFTSSELDHGALVAMTSLSVLVVGGTYETAIAPMPKTPIADEVRGAAMLCSSGTTGRPKGITPVLDPVGIDVPPVVTASLTALYGFSPESVYLSTAPLYHAAPLKFSMSVQQIGGTVVVMEKFDPAAALCAIDRHRITHSQWVPTMFLRMLQLSDDKKQFDGRSHRCAIHAAAPCPIAVKEAMIDWWGPILHEYYSGSESVGQTAITSEEWLKKKGSVGRASRGIVHIIDDAGIELGPGETGYVYFEGGSPFSYHGDPEKTARAFDHRGWGTFGDIGHIDEDGYLFLSDRKDYVINIGGVNIYPQEAENLLAAHPKVADVAVFGIPNAEYGEEVKAVVQPRAPAAAGPEPEAELIAYCRAHLAANKCPRSVDFESDMPREPAGKLLKRHLKARYWPAAGDPT
jgi:long-chain acyl-CoA synthetase